MSQSTARRTVAFIAATCLVLSAFVATATASKYPAKYEQQFTKTCSSAARSAGNGKVSKAKATAYCKAALKCIEGKLTLKQFEITSERMAEGKRNPNAKVLASCEKSAAAKTLK